MGDVSHDMIEGSTTASLYYSWHAPSLLLLLLLAPRRQEQQQLPMPQQVLPQLRVRQTHPGRRS